MSDSSQGLWYNSSNGSAIPLPLYSEEKAKLAGDLSCAILYGTLTHVVPCRCSLHSFDLIVF